ncbi:uncharacterized protein LOC115698633 [Cannabis sativa]|uniref:Uncharacterized protein n=1 Tax=Cannabis sativa TaxID=3483 RepID=A0A7J6GFE5_CANSA|nr:uncharacterized protein LOC115698633 [Cannabis sativa]XP_030481621.2 uncharacterized protein LOC115698633 [Cannabis sativa]XP_030481622.2 uncharacterized protein LOC115698633 [Cannabis sativa]XP_060958867.1 uncharacterized protein LOC115698633 [Cannabis sativa]XP_060958868.1 uncharacterized protein LOC115698633 [Cannabis sativa]KAF4381562.1 hypothetical protein F8388_021190 [Cannabis sativa]KAF4399918.1 hypothetical protein G4B88_021132 [Cannabis sativa]
MEEDKNIKSNCPQPPRVSRKNGNRSRNHSRKTEGKTDQVDGGDRIKCSGNSCRSCAAALIADCVALCCCPLAVINFFTFAFVKVPWAVGKKCLRRWKKKKNKNKSKCEKGHQYNDSDGSVVGGERWWREEGIMEISSSSGEKNDTVEDSVWMELYQVGHLGFGRVSFSGIQPSQVKGN